MRCLAARSAALAERAFADFMIPSPLMSQEYSRRVLAYDDSDTVPA